MNTNKLMKLIISPSSNIGAYYKIIEQQEKLAKKYSPIIAMNNSIQMIVEHYKTLNEINKSFRLPLSTSETIRKLIDQTTVISTKYSNYYNQLNNIVKILNPSLSSFISANSRSSFTKLDSIESIDLLYINSFDAVKDDYDDSVKEELNTLNNNFEASTEFRSEVATLLENGTEEITIDIYQAFAKLIEKYVGVIASRTIAVFLFFFNIDLYCFNAAISK